MSNPLRVIIVEDSEDDALLVIDELRAAGYDPAYERVETREQLETALDGQEWDLIIADYRLPDFTGTEALEIVRSRSENCPFIIVSGQISEDTAVNAMKAGANDYVLKNNMVRLAPAVERELREAEVRRRRQEVESALQVEKERSHIILESITDGFYAVDRDWQFTYVNGAAERLIGENWRELKGRSLWDVSPYLAGSDLRNELLRSMVERVPVASEIFIASTQRWEAIRAYPYADGLAVYVRDTTDQKRAEAELGAARRRAEVLQSIAEAGLTTLDLQELLDTLVVRVREVLKSNSCSIWILDENAEEFEAKAACDAPELIGSKLSVNAGIAGDIYTGRHPVYVADAKRDPRLQDELFKNRRIEAVLGLPLMIRGKVIGMVRVELDAPKDFDKEEIGLLEAVALRASQAIENARLYHDLQVSLQRAERERQRASVLASVAEAAISTFDLQQLLDTFALKTTEGMQASSGHVLLIDEQKGEFVVEAVHNVPEQFKSRTKLREGFAGKIYKERATIYVADAQADPSITDPYVDQPGIRSLLGTPLIVRDKVIGVLYVDTRDVRTFAPEDVELLEAMAARVASVVESARLNQDLMRSRNDLQSALDRETHFSLLLQRALLPSEPYIGSNYDVAAEYIPMYASREIGGDFYDVFTVDERWAGVLVGDVSGKGLEAAAMAATTRSTIHAYVHENPSSARALERTNSVLCSQQEEFGAFATVVLVIIDCLTGELNYASAGHPPAMIARRNGQVEFLKTGQLPLALVGSQSFEEHHGHLGIGDKLVLYTDGISESRQDGEMLELEGIAEILKRHTQAAALEIAQALLQIATEWSRGKLADDAAVVVVERACEQAVSDT